MMYPPGPPLRTDNEIWEALTKRIRIITGLTAVRTEESGERPATPFISVSFLGSRPLRDNPRGFEYDPPDRDDDEADTGGNLPDVTATPLIDTEWHFSVWAYGSDTPSMLLRPLRSAAELSQVMEPIYPYLSVMPVERIRNLAEVVNERYEMRAQCDIFLHGVTQDGFVIDTIDATPFTVNRL